MNPVGREIAKLFHDMAEDDLFELLQFFEYRHGTAGEELWREGDSGDYAAFIVSGRAQVRKQTEFEGKQVLVGVYSAGTVIGELGLLEQEQRSVSASVLEDCVLLTLSREKFERLIECHPLLGVKLLKSLFLTVSIRLKKSTDRLAAIF